MGEYPKKYQRGKIDIGRPRKRWSLVCEDGTGRCLILVVPVSYTHLDVYKRQDKQ